jgi:hypothetical protein
MVTRTWQGWILFVILESTIFWCQELQYKSQGPLELLYMSWAEGQGRWSHMGHGKGAG